MDTCKGHTTEMLESFRLLPADRERERERERERLADG
jgi:hypothetical protein